MLYERSRSPARISGQGYMDRSKLLLGLGVFLAGCVFALAVVRILNPSWTRAVLVGLGWVLVIVGVWLLGRGW